MKRHSKPAIKTKFDDHPSLADMPTNNRRKRKRMPMKHPPANFNERDKTKVPYFSNKFDR